MKRHTQLEPLRIYQVDLLQWSHPAHAHDFYELIIIQAGKGYHIINDNCFPYASGHVFLLGPNDNHFFTIDEPTTFCFISFTESYLAGLPVSSNSIWKQRQSDSLHTVLGFAGNLITQPINQLHLNALLSILLTTNESNVSRSPSVTSSVLGAILCLLEPQRSEIGKKALHPSHYSTELAHRIIAYISQHITEPKQVRIEQLADIFNYSPGYLSALFKQQVGESLQVYIVQYRLKLVQKRLQHSSLTISQIADEFGFTDICHLNKLFKRYYHLTPMVYRRDTATS